MRVIGIDPGPTPGVCVLDLGPTGILNVELVQCTAGVLFSIVGTLRQTAHGDVRMQVERFVTRGCANLAQSVTRDQVGELVGWGAVQRNAGQVKPWATDARLDRAGLLDAAKGMRHARDAARHALFAACHDAGLPDPLSNQHGTTRKKELGA